MNIKATNKAIKKATKVAKLNKVIKKVENNNIIPNPFIKVNI